MDSKDVIERFYGEIWNAHNAASASDICSDDLTFKGSLKVQCVGIASFLTYVDSVHDSLASYHCGIQELVTDSDRGFARLHFSGQHTGEFLGFSPTNEILSWSGAALFHLANGKIYSVWVLGDLYGLYRQLSGNA